MLGSPLLGTAVGLVLLFAATALLCSGITETVSNALQMRAKYLLTGMRAMLDETDREAGPGDGALAGTGAALTALKGAPGGDGRVASPLLRVQTAAGKRRKAKLHEEVKNPGATRRAAEAVRADIADPTTPPARPPLDLTTALWNDPLLASLQSRRVGAWWAATVRNPQYVSGRTFVRALVDLLVPPTPGEPPPVAAQMARLRAAVEELPVSQPVRAPLLAFLARAGDDLGAFERAVEQWYDEQMAKIAGWYKRWARVVLGIVGFLVAVAVNVDTLQVGHALYVDAPLQQAVLATADTGTLCQGEPDPAARGACVARELDALGAEGLPLGYAADCHWLEGRWRACWAWSAQDPPSAWDPWRKLLGWLITAFAVSFGAPFWFEALSRLGSLRNTGTRPADAPPPA